MVAQVAAEDPDTVPEIAQPRMVTCIKRPGSQPSHGESPSNISSESLVRYRISPIQTNIGSAASVHEALDPQNDWNRFTSGGVLVKNCRPNQAPRQGRWRSTRRRSAGSTAGRRESAPR